MGPILTVESLEPIRGNRVAFSEVFLVKYGLNFTFSTNIAQPKAMICLPSFKSISAILIVFKTVTEKSHKMWTTFLAVRSRYKVSLNYTHVFFTQMFYYTVIIGEQ